MDIEKATQAMEANLPKNTGKKLEEWLRILHKESFEKHGEIVKFLKAEHNITHGYANFIAHRAKDANSSEKSDSIDLIESQYKGKDQLREIYEKLIAEIRTFGKDIEISPKKSYVSLRRSKQFATLNPATKTRFEIGLNLKGTQATSRLLAEKANAMCSHKINLSDISEIDDEVLSFLKEAFDKAK